ncbi:type 1 glutamine amidotransferase domain-containing protein [Telmatocola sphagniphila]|uniref:Type 1 glutamine amidotransferase domain-containing protein n=1 Tax=Telmatocola sphagniphila TaxID=1123043 RepID=A0A8E6B3H3_9BACT|nr:type 1 glutamine amidotransferase domain-containing protein [Telmatocola sphagniphila]QVL31258.1 type 1 glutamine amidotransferase domain-containing protein [Telmatocola sphagniphila]
MAGTNRILIIVTNVGEYEKVGFRTGLWLGEMTHFWDVAEQAGYRMDIASPLGGFIPIDPESLAHDVLKMGETDKRYMDRAFMDQLKNTRKVAEVDAANYDAIYMTGGHGVCFDFNKSTDLAKLTAEFYESGKIVSAVCHGPAGLLEVKLSTGDYLIAGKQVTGFSWNEEIKAGREAAVPYNLEEQLQKRGAKYGKAWMAFASHIVEDGRLITGQNPASAEGVGKAVVKQLRKAK